jgi:hypothetical protein
LHFCWRKSKKEKERKRKERRIGTNLIMAGGRRRGSPAKEKANNGKEKATVQPAKNRKRARDVGSLDKDLSNAEESGSEAENDDILKFRKGQEEADKKKSKYEGLNFLQYYMLLIKYFVHEGDAPPSRMAVKLRALSQDHSITTGMYI